MYIAPNSIIKIMHNVPLDDTYNHTIYFATKSAQDTYFSGVNVVKYTLNDQTYQRVERGKMRIEIKAEDLYDCNYLAFQNTSFGSKWFYAFITGVEYVNNITSEVSFELDVLQTYWFDITIGQCFVEREHVVDDTIGANTIAEPVDCPEAEVSDGLNLPFTNWHIAVNYAPSFINQLANAVDLWTDNVDANIQSKIDDEEAETHPNDFTIGALRLIKLLNSIINSTANTLFPNNLGEIREHQYTGKIPYVTPDYFDDTAYGSSDQVCTEVQADIDAMNALGGKVLEVYQVPTEIVNNSWADSPNFDIPDSIFDPIPTYSYIDKETYYTPKNNKLYTSPYTYLKVINKQGGEMNLAYEKIQEREFTFTSSYQNGQVSCFMENHKYGTKGALAGECKDLCRLQITNFPVCNFNTTGIISRLVSAINSLSKSLMSSIGVQATQGNMATPQAPVQERNDRGQFQNTGAYIQQYQAYKKYSAQYEAQGGKEDVYNTGSMVNNYISQLGSISNNFIGEITHMRGDSSMASNDIANNNFGYRICCMQITAEYAEIIDNFFERFGYAVKKNKVPNISTRPHWNYVKTTDAYITGNCPADSLAKIISIFNHGITFWKSASEVGNYSLNNHTTT